MNRRDFLRAAAVARCAAPSAGYAELDRRYAEAIKTTLRLRLARSALD